MQLERQLQALEARLGEKLRHEREAIVSALRRELRGGGGTTRATARPSEHSASSAAATTAPSACALATPRTIGFASGCRSAASPPAAPEPSSSASLDSARSDGGGTNWRHGTATNTFPTSRAKPFHTDFSSAVGVATSFRLPGPAGTHDGSDRLPPPLLCLRPIDVRHPAAGSKMP